MDIKIILKIFVNRKIAYILMGNMKDYQGLFIRAVKVDFIKKRKKYENYPEFLI